MMITRIFLNTCLMITVSTQVFAQSGKYVNAPGGTCKNAKVFIDYRVQEHCGTSFTVNWTGSCKEGYADGKGTLTISSTLSGKAFTLTYEGELKKGKKEGQGVENLYQALPGFAPYYTYTGGFSNNDFNGYGEFVSDYAGSNVSALWRGYFYFDSYKGLFNSGRIADTDNGSGTTRWLSFISKTVEYKGPVKNGFPEGEGSAIETGPLPGIILVKPANFRESSYKGGFSKGALNGRGVLNYGSGSNTFSYDGEFVRNNMQGNGMLTYYEQSWSGGVFKGWDTDQIVEGSFVNNKANGFCTIYYQNSAAYKYTGPMVNGDREGTGEVEYLDGSKFRGNFKNGKREGDGAVQFADGNKFSGVYTDDKPTGGTLYYSDGSKYEGAFAVREEIDKITGKPVQVYIRQGRGYMTNKDGRKYNVTCDNDNCTEQ